jgi:hypothetical protein
MFKYFVGLVFLIFISCTGRVYSQSRVDTTFSEKQADSAVMDSTTIIRDSLTTTAENTSSVTNEDSLYMPVKDSGFPVAYARRQVSESRLNHYLSEPEYAYANDPEYWKKNKTADDSHSFSLFNFFRRKPVQWFLFLTVFAIILYGIYLLAKENNFKWLTRKSNPVTPGTPASGIEQPLDFDDAIRKYQSEGNYRMAVRNMYLRLIHTVNSRNIIHIGDSFTNSEMMRAFGSHPQASEFRFLATAYEYVYYGEFIMTPELFEGIKTRFDVFQQKLSV